MDADKRPNHAIANPPARADLERISAMNIKADIAEVSQPLTSLTFNLNRFAELLKWD
ncbi:MAG: hypothetical protein ACKN9E_05240 [Microcystaceae cyanobacterium]